MSLNKTPSVPIDKQLGQAGKMKQASVAVTTTAEDHRVAALAALAIAIHILEAALPSPFPGIKPGLANVITVITLFAFGWRSAVWVSLLRVVVGSLLVGSFLGPTFILSFSGAVAALLAMIGLHYAMNGRVSALSVSAVAAMVHMMAQICVAYWFFIPHAALFNLVPFLLSIALVFGIISGLIANRVLQHLN